MEQAQLAALAERIGLPLTEAEQAAILPAVEKALARTPELDVEAATARAGWGPYSSAALSDSYAIGGSVEPGEVLKHRAAPVCVAGDGVGLDAVAERDAADAVHERHVVAVEHEVVHVGARLGHGRGHSGVSEG